MKTVNQNARTTVVCLLFGMTYIIGSAFITSTEFCMDHTNGLKLILKSSIEAFHKYEQIISQSGRKNDLQRSDGGTIERIVFVESNYDFGKEQWYSG